MAASPVVLSQKAIYLNADTLQHTAASLRRITDTFAGVGVQDLNSFRVRQRVAGAAMSVDVTDAATISQAYVRGSIVNLQGLYMVHNVVQGTGTIDALYNVDIAAADPTNPRIDQVFLAVEDAQHAGANNQATIRVVTGTPTGGTTLDLRTGVGAAPAGMSSILLADVLVPAASATVVTANIRDRRPFGNFGTVPPLGSTGTQADMVAFEPHPSTSVGGGVGAAISGYQQITAGTHDSTQSAALMWLPRRVVSATKIRFKYHQGGTAAATNWNVFIADASGRVIVSTGSTAFAGIAASWTEVSATITTTTFEAGWYYVGIGIAPMTASSAVYYNGVVAHFATVTPPVTHRNIVFRSATGGITAPTTILAFTDVASLSAAVTAAPMAPVIALSVT